VFRGHNPVYLVVVLDNVSGPDPITTDIGYHDMLLKLDLLRTPSEDCARLTFFCG
jgi:hypothetical protein